MQTPDWTHFRSAETDPSGPCCLLEKAFNTKHLPRNYIWTIGYLGTWKGAEEAEISAQVRSYSREYLEQRSKDIQEKKRKEAETQAELSALREERKQQLDRMTDKYKGFADEESTKRRIEAGPLAMAKSLVKSAADLATGGVTDPSARMEICNSCPFKGDDQRCGKCGCFLPAKTRVKKSSCPIGRW